LAIGYWLLGVGYWLLAIGYWLLVVGYWLLVIGCWVLAIGCWVLAAGLDLAFAGTGPKLILFRESLAPVSGFLQLHPEYVSCPAWPAEPQTLWDKHCLYFGNQPVSAGGTGLQACTIR
jgi:hypothetical protein